MRLLRELPHMILVYSDSNIIDNQWIPNINFTQNYTLCHNFDEYISSPSTIKIAFTTHRLHCDYDINCMAYQGFEDKINQLSDASTVVFTFESELHDFHWRVWEKCHHENVYWVLPGSVNDRDDINSHIIFWGYTNKSLDEIIDYEKKLFRNYKYILGFNDCRHYTRILANWTTNKPTPIWRIKNILLEKNARLK